MYRARPSARAVVHTHSTYSVAVSCMRDANRDNAIPPLTAYYAMRVGALPLLPYHAPGDPALGPLAEQTATDHHALLLANHGPIVAAGRPGLGGRRPRRNRRDREASPAAAGPPDLAGQRHRSDQIARRPMTAPMTTQTPAPPAADDVVAHGVGDPARPWASPPTMPAWCPNRWSPPTCGDIHRTACCAWPGTSRGCAQVR